MLTGMTDIIAMYSLYILQTYLWRFATLVFTSKTIGLRSVFWKACILYISTLTNLKQLQHFTAECPHTLAGKTIDFLK